MDIDSIYNLCEQLYKHRDHVLAHLEPSERERVAGNALEQCDSVMYLQGSPSAMYEAINAFTMALAQRVPLGEVAPDSTVYIDAVDLGCELGELFQVHFDAIPESAHCALAIYQGQVQQFPDPTDPDAAMDHLIGIVSELIAPQV